MASVPPLERTDETQPTPSHEDASADVGSIEHEDSPGAPSADAVGADVGAAAAGEGHDAAGDADAAKAEAELRLERELEEATEKASEQQRRHAAAALIALAAGATEDARYRLRLVNLHSKILKANATPGGLKPLLAVALPCVALVSALHALPLSVVKVASFIVDVEVRSVRFEFSTPWAVENTLNATGMTLRRASRVSATFLPEQSGSGNGDQGLDADAKSVRLTSLRVDSAGSLELATERNSLQLDVWGERIAGEALLTGTAKVRAAGKSAPEDVDATVPETVDFTASGSTVAPLEVRFRNPGAWALPLLRPTSIRFAEQDGAPMHASFSSSILHGSIRILDGDPSRVETLFPGDALVIGPTRCRRVSVTPGDGTLHVVADCASSQLRAGPPGFERNLIPSILETIYKKQTLATLWAAIAFLWGLGWGAKKALRGSSD
jgi:hypothetical protein